MRFQKKIFTIILASLLLCTGLFSQEKAPWKTAIGALGNRTQSSGSIFGIYISKFDVNYGYSLSTVTLGGNMISMGILSSRVFYQANPSLSFSGEIGFVHNPFSSFSNEFNSYSSFNKDNLIFKGLVTYKPTKNSFITIGFEKNPYNYYSNYSNFYSPGFLR